MLTVAEWDYEMGRIADFERQIVLLQRTINTTRTVAESLARLEYVQREPGFPCWRIEGVIGYFNTEREAIEALEE